MTERLSHHERSAADARVVDRVCDVLSGGGIVVVPTDTVYGLAALPGHRTAPDRLFAAKGRGADVPLAVLCASLDQAFGLASEVPETARELAARHWPGPLTLVLPRHADALRWRIGRPAETVGVRVPDHALLRAVAARLGPVATTSANRHGAPTPSGAVDAAGSLLGDIDLVVDGGRIEGRASTVIDATGTELVVLRAGAVSIAER